MCFRVRRREQPSLSEREVYDADGKFTIHDEGNSPLRSEISQTTVAREDLDSVEKKSSEAKARHWCLYRFPTSGAPQPLTPWAYVLYSLCVSPSLSLCRSHFLARSLSVALNPPSDPLCSRAAKGRYGFIKGGEGA